MVTTSQTAATRSAIVIALVALAPAIAFAQGNPADVEFNRGKELLKQGKYAEACAAFDKSQALEASVSVMLNQANCREKNGQLATARKLFQTAAQQTDGLTDAKNAKLHKVAVDHAAQLADRVSTLVVDVQPANRVIGLAIKRDADVIDPASWNQPLALDGGTYTIEASAPDRKSFTQTITINVEKDRKTVTVPALEVIAKPAVTNPDVTKPDGTKPDGTKPDGTTPDTTKPDGTKPDGTKPDGTKPDGTKPDGTKPDVAVPIAPHRSRTLPLVVGAGGVALVGLSVGFVVWAGSTYDKAKIEGNDTKQYDLWQSANHKRYFAEIAGIGGIAAVGVSVFLFLRSNGEGPPRVQPSVGTDHASVLLNGRF